MSVLIEGKRIDTKLLAAGPFADDAETRHRIKAERGSRMLRDAVFRARGYVPLPDPVPQRPIFKTRKIDLRGRPKGSRKVRKISPRIMRIMEATAKHYRVSIAALIAPGKGADLVEARQLAMYLVRRMTTASYPDIGFHFGGRDHTTVIHGEREVEKKIASVHVRTLNALNAIHKALTR